MSHGFLKPNPKINTIALHAGHRAEDCSYKALVPSIVTATTFKQYSPGEDAAGFAYSRDSNPTRHGLEECLAAMEGGKYAYAFSSGMGAISSVIMSVLTAGDHIICNDDTYGGTYRLLRKVIEELKIEITLADLTDLSNLTKEIKANTKMVWIETPTNPQLRVIDISAVSKTIKQKNIVLAVDNTFLTCYLQRPLDFGADIVVYSLTKFMNGHSDVVMGAAIVNDKKIADRIQFFQSSMGAVPSPFDCYLTHRSLKTLPLRMERHKASSLAIAQWLEQHPKVVKVSHPGLPSHPQHEVAKKQTCGQSGVFSFHLCGNVEDSKKFLTSFKLFALADSLGGSESTIALPALMSHCPLPKAAKQKLGITESLIRISVGLEDVNDLIEDLEQALQKVV